SSELIFNLRRKFRITSFVRGRRKLRLFGCACCHKIWDLLVDDRSRKAVEMSEDLLMASLIPGLYPTHIEAQLFTRGEHSTFRSGMDFKRRKQRCARRLPRGNPLGILRGRP